MSTPVITLHVEERRDGTSVVTFAGGVLVEGTGAVVCQAARKLIEFGVDPRKRLEARRAGAVSLSGPLGLFAGVVPPDAGGEAA